MTLLRTLIALLLVLALALPAPAGTVLHGDNQRVRVEDTAGSNYLEFTASDIIKNGASILAGFSDAFPNGGNAGGADRSLGNTDNYALSLVTNNIARLIISAGGSVMVPGAARFSSEVSVTGDIVKYLSATASGGGISVLSSDGGYMKFTDAISAGFTPQLDFRATSGTASDPGVWMYASPGQDSASNAAWSFNTLNPAHTGALTSSDLIRLTNFLTPVWRINSSGNMTLGATDLASTAYKLFINGAQAIKNSADDDTYSYIRNYSTLTNTAPYLFFTRSRGSYTGTTNTATSTNDILGVLRFSGVNPQNNLNYGAEIAVTQTSIDNDTNIPAKIEMKTSNGASALQTAFIINDSQNVTLGATDLASTTSKLYVDGALKATGAAKFSSEVAIGDTAAGTPHNADLKIYAVANATYGGGYKHIADNGGYLWMYDGIATGYSPTIEARSVGGGNADSGMYLSSVLGVDHASNAAFEFTAYRPDRAGAATASDLLKIANYSTSVARINSSGNLTLGATDLASTTSKLYVDGALKATGAATFDSTLFTTGNQRCSGEIIVGAASYASLNLNTPSNDWSINARNSDAALTITDNGVADRLVINSSGNTTLGATDLASTTSKLYVDGNFHVQSATASTPSIWSEYSDGYAAFFDNTKPFSTAANNQVYFRQKTQSGMGYTNVIESGVSRFPKPGGLDSYFKIYSAYGTQSTVGFYINDSGAVTLGSSDLAGTSYRLLTDGPVSAGASTSTGGMQLNVQNNNADGVYMQFVKNAGGAQAVGYIGSQKSIAGGGSNNILTIYGGQGVYTYGGSTIAQFVNGSGNTTFGSSGTDWASTTSKLYVSNGDVTESNTSWCQHFMQSWNSATASLAPMLHLERSKNSNTGTHTVVANGDTLGYITFDGSDGTNFEYAAAIIAEVDGTPGNNDMPGRLRFTTTPDGSNVDVTRMLINNAGNVTIGNADGAGTSFQLRVYPKSGFSGTTLFIDDGNGTPNVGAEIQNNKNGGIAIIGTANGTSGAKGVYAQIAYGPTDGYALFAEANNNSNYSGYFDKGQFTVNLGSTTSYFTVNNLQTTTGTNIVIDASNRLAKASSSIRYKENVHPMPSLTDEIMRLDPVTFNFKNQTAECYGLIAESVEVVLPKVVQYSKTNSGELQVESIDYNQVTSALVKVVQDQQRKIDSMEVWISSHQ